jgi:predicted  nucleic acid-binding Zn-ribbon protein
MFSFIFTAKVEELLTEIKETEAEVVRWREACELEVEAAKKAIEEREKLVNKITSTLPGFKRILFKKGGGGRMGLRDQCCVYLNKLLLNSNAEFHFVFIRLLS